MWKKGVRRERCVAAVPPKVLDMCASPGSKTTQVVEKLHAAGDAFPAGFVIANEANSQREKPMKNVPLTT